MAGSIKDVRSVLLPDGDQVDWRKAKVTGMFDHDDMVDFLMDHESNVVVLDHIGENRLSQTAWCRAVIGRDRAGGYRVEFAWDADPMGGLGPEEAVDAAIQEIREVWEQTPPTMRNDPHLPKVSGHMRRRREGEEGAERIIDTLEQATEDQVIQGDPRRIPRDSERPNVSDRTVTPERYRRGAPGERRTGSTT